MANDTQTRTLPLDGLVGVTLLEAIDADGRITEDPTTAVEGVLIATYRSATGLVDRAIAFDTARPIPSGSVAP